MISVSESFEAISQLHPKLEIIIWNIQGETNYATTFR
jgi:hypothetical protein